MNLFVDSGAPTLYNTLVRKNKKSGVMGAHISDRKYDDFSFVETDEYKQYREEFIQFIKANKSLINVFANLDIINNPELTWENQLYLESKGINPIPVYHFGSDLKWLEKYLKKGYKYIAIGGMIPNSFSVLKTPLDELWNKYLTDRKGYPLVKVHGFAVTSPRLVHRYPWYSVDSTSWVKFGMYGAIIIPKKVSGKYEYKNAPNVVFVSARSPKIAEKNKHIGNLSSIERSGIINYIEHKGFNLGKSVCVLKDSDYILKPNESLIKIIGNKKSIERVIEPGVCNNNIIRDTLNACFFIDMANSTPTWPWPFKYKRNSFL